MSEANQDSVQTTQVSDQVETQTNSNPVDDYKRDMFRYKSEAKDLKEKLKEYELKEAEAKGNLQDVISKLKDENRSLRGDLAKSKVSFADGKIEDAIKAEALKRGCKDADTFYKLIDRTDIDTVELDSKFNANRDDVKVILDKYSKNYEHLGFFNKKVNIVDATPNNKPIETKTKTKGLDEMSHEELMEYAKKVGFKTINR